MDGDAICSLRSFLFKNTPETDLEIKTVILFSFEQLFAFGATILQSCHSTCHQKKIIKRLYLYNHIQNFLYIRIVDNKCSGA